MNYVWTLKDIISWLAVISSFLVYATGSKTCFSIIQKKTTGDVTLFPFIASLYCGVIWFKYGMLTTLQNLVIASGANTICQITYIIIYYTYSRDRSRVGKVIFVSAAILYTLLFYFKYLTKHNEEAIAKLGILGMASTILMNGAPFVSLVDVIKYKSTASLDFWFIAMCFVSTSLWSCFGFYVRDFNVFVPNGIGATLSILQLSLFVLYPANTKEYTPKDEEKMMLDKS